MSEASKTTSNTAAVTSSGLPDSVDSSESLNTIGSVFSMLFSCLSMTLMSTVVSILTLRHLAVPLLFFVVVVVVVACRSYGIFLRGFSAEKINFVGIASGLSRICCPPRDFTKHSGSKCLLHR